MTTIHQLIADHEAAMMPWKVENHPYYGIGFDRCGFVGRALLIRGCQSGQYGWGRVFEEARRHTDAECLPDRFLRIPYAGPQTKEAAAELLTTLFDSEKYSEGGVTLE